MRALIFIVLMALAVGSSSQAAVRKCAGRATLTGSGIGALRIGEPVERVKRACRVLSDKRELGPEALPSRVLEVVVGSKPVQAEVVHGRIWRIAVTDVAPRTADGLGVGSSLAKLLETGKATGVEGEGALFAISPRHCGLSFHLSYEPGDDEHRDEWTNRQLAQLPAATRVTEVLVVGCKR